MAAEIFSPKFSAASVSTLTPVTSIRRPTTRLHQGISKPKIYTDGTVRWCMTTATTERPAVVHEAFLDPN